MLTTVEYTGGGLLGEKKGASSTIRLRSGRGRTCVYITYTYIYIHIFRCVWGGLCVCVRVCVCVTFYPFISLSCNTSGRGKEAPAAHPPEKGKEASVCVYVYI